MQIGFGQKQLKLVHRSEISWSGRRHANAAYIPCMANDG